MTRSNADSKWRVLASVVFGIFTVQTPFTAALADVAHNALPRATSLVSSTRYLVQAYGIAALATQLGTKVLDRGQVTLEGLHRAYMLTFWLPIAGLGLGMLLPGWPGKATASRRAIAD